MKKIVFLFAAAIFAVKSLFAADPMVTQIRVLDASFDKLSVATGIRVDLANGKQYLEVKTFERYQDDIETYVKDGTLVIRWANGRAPRVIRGGDVTVKVANPSLRSISCSSGARIESDGFRMSEDARLSVSSGARMVGSFSGEDIIASASSGSRLGDVTIQCEELTLSSSSGSSIKASIRCEDVHLSASSGSRIELSGRCEEVSGSCSSGSRLACRDLVARDVTASASSGASAEFTATGQTRTSKSGGGSVTIHQNRSVTITR